jgi:hypothetical protein
MMGEVRKSSCRDADGVGKLLWVGEVGFGEFNVEVLSEEGSDERAAGGCNVANFEGGDATEGFMGCSVMRMRDARSKFWPPSVMVIWENSHAPVPVSPEDLYRSVGFGVVTHGGGSGGVQGFGQDA